MPHPPDVEIVRRRVDIHFAPDDAVDWFPGQTTTEVFLNAISFFFPPGERFFIDSVRQFEDRIVDPGLQDQVRRFIHQEAMHSRVHSLFNDALLQTYPLGPRIQWMASSTLELTRRFMPNAYQLAVTCAVEHYTAVLADALLRRIDHVTRTAHPACIEMWAWHAVEETEHKAVCFDVYTAMVGRGPLAYLTRTAAMLVVTLFFIVAVSAGVLFIRSGRRATSDAAPAGTGPRGKGTHALLAALIPWRLWFAYFRPGFHPWDHDNRDLIEAWKQRFPGFGETPPPA